MGKRGSENRLHVCTTPDIAPGQTAFVRGVEETPHRCPVCAGAGTVFESLYTRLPTTTVTDCRSCGGTGVLWQ